MQNRIFQLLSPADSTGTHSLYTNYQGYEVMFHVSTMLPYMPNNPQQVRANVHPYLRGAPSPEFLKLGFLMWNREINPWLTFFFTQSFQSQTVVVN